MNDPSADLMFPCNSLSSDVKKGGGGLTTPPSMVVAPPGKFSTLPSGTGDSSLALMLTEEGKSSPAMKAKEVSEVMTKGARAFMDALKGTPALGTKMGYSEVLESSVLKVDQSIMKSRVEALRFSIVGRITLGKGDEPWSHLKLKEKLGEIWSPKGAWRLVSLGRGFYQIVLTNEEDYNKIWAKGMLSLHPGIMRLQRWHLGFDPAKVKSTHVQAWVLLYNLPWGFWMPEILLSIARRIGIPLKIDGATLNGEFGHYARILVDIDLSLPIKSVVHLEFGDMVFDVRIVP